MLNNFAHGSRRYRRQQSGLSVSHDSVFTAEASGGDSDDERSRPRLRPSMAKGVPVRFLKLFFIF